MKKTSRDWVSVHLFCDRECFDVLRIGVQRFLILNRKFFKMFFFIRYSENGFHIRLRILPSKYASVHDLKDKIRSYFCDLIIFDEIDLSFKKVYFVHFVDYIPEFTRYGGESNIFLVEKMFYFSSLTVLNFYNLILPKYIRNSYDLLYSFSLIFALKMNLIFIKSFNLSLNYELNFYKRNVSIWLPSVRYGSKIDYSDIQIFNLFETSFENLDPNLINSLLDFYANLCENIITDRNLIDWHKKCLYFSKRFKSVYCDINEFENSFFSIGQSIIHMTNNRLGVLNGDESFLSYIATRILNKFHVGL